MNQKTKRATIWLCIILTVILLCSVTQNLVMTNFGTVRVEDVSWVTDDGAYMSARIYIPDGVSAAHPAPAIVAAHGWNNTHEVQEVNCIELSRRGYVVISTDAYGHGNSTQTAPDMTDDDLADGVENNTVNLDAQGDAAVQDGGVYSALQYLGTLPFVDEKNIGLVGHSMGGYTIQMAAYRALVNARTDESVIVPNAMLVTCEGADANYDGMKLNIATITPEYDEFGAGHWNIPTSVLANTSAKLKAYFGFAETDPDIEYGAFYKYGEDSAISRSGAISAAKNGQLRTAYLCHGRTHPGVHNSGEAVEYMVEFFGITLKGGAVDEIAPMNQTWLIKNIAGLVSLVMFFMLMIPVATLLLSSKFFSSLTLTPYEGVELKTGGSKLRYALLFIAGLLPAALLFYPLVGNPISVKFMNFACPIPWQESDAFPMPIMNGLSLFNLVCGVIAVALFFVIYFIFAKKDGVSLKDYGVKTPFKDILKALLLAVIVFAASYITLAAANEFFNIDFRFFTLSIKTLSAVRWGLYLRYVLFFAVFYIANSLLLNATIAVKGKREWANCLLCALSSVGGILIIHVLDYSYFFLTGFKLLGSYSSLGGNSSMAGILAWGLLFVLPVAAVVARTLYKKTGNIWVGGLINSIAVTFFAISNTAISTGIFD